MNINTTEIQKNINRLIDAGISPILKELLWFKDADNIKWLIENHELYNYKLWQYDRSTGKVYISDDFLKSKLHEMEEELKAFRSFGKPVITDHEKLFEEINLLEKQKSFIEQKLNELN